MRSRGGQSFVSMLLGVLAVGIAASGCATAGSETRHGLGVGEWQARLPTTASPIHELAYGRGGSSTPSLDALASLESDAPDDVLQSPASKPAPLAKATPKRAIAAPASVLAAVTALETPENQAAPAVATPAEPTELAQNDVDARYATREVQANEQQRFRGGDAIVISAGALVVVLLIVILILLLR